MLAPIQKWRLVLGPAADPEDEVALPESAAVSLKARPDGQGQAPEPEEDTLQESISWKKMDVVLEQLYGEDERGAGLQKSSPKVNAWLQDIRTYFNEETVVFLQKEAFTRLGLAQMLLQPETLNQVVPDTNMLVTLLQLKHLMKGEALDAARQLIKQWAEALQEQLKLPLLRSVQGSLSRTERINNPKLQDLDLPLTIRANLKHYNHSLKSIIPERLVGHGRKGKSLQHIFLLVDQSGSMAHSVVYAGIIGSILATINSLRTRLVVFDTTVVDLSDELQDPVSLLLGTQLGGGTNIQLALQYAVQQIEAPAQTHLFLISDLFEGPNPQLMLDLTQQLLDSGVRMYVLLALNNEGRPAYHLDLAQTLTNMGVPVFACTPNRFAEVLSDALEGREIQI